MHVDSFTPDQVAASSPVTRGPRGPPSRSGSSASSAAHSTSEGAARPGGVVVPTRAFVEKYLDQIGSFTGTILRVRTRARAGRRPRSRGRGAPDLGQAGKAHGGQYEFSTTSLAVEGDRRAARGRRDTAGLWILAGVAAAAGLVALALALARYVRADRGRRGRCSASLGVRRVERWAAATATVVPLAVAGAATGGRRRGARVAAVPRGCGAAGRARPRLSHRLVDPRPRVRRRRAGGDGSRAPRGARRDAAQCGARRASRRPDCRPGRRGLPADRLDGCRLRARAPGRAVGSAGSRRVWSARSSASWASSRSSPTTSSLDRLASTPALYGLDLGLRGHRPAGERRALHPGRHAARTRPGDRLDRRVLSRQRRRAGPPGERERVRGDQGRADRPRDRGRARAEGPARDRPGSADALDAVGRASATRYACRATAGRPTFRIVGQAVFPSIGDAVPLSDGATLSRRGLLRLER